MFDSRGWSLRMPILEAAYWNVIRIIGLIYSDWRPDYPETTN